MKRRILERHSRRWWVLSVAAHVVILTILAQIAFKYSLGQLMGIPKPEVTQERLHYISIPPGPAEHSGGVRSETPSKTAASAPLPAPTSIPSNLPTLQPLDSSRARTAGGTGTGLDVTGSGLATGVVPLDPDARIQLTPGTMVRTPRTVAEDVDSIVMLAIGIVRDSLSMAAAQRKPGDWTIKGKDGQVWGWDPQGNIRLGKFTIPGALLALLPLNRAGGGSPIEARSAAWIRRDILEHAQYRISEDEFRAAVKRIRERKERERRERQLAEKTPPSQP
jgi:hypothetical protein